ncbi:hypothetical protein GDO78_000575 [Eleutherodactylus coqui]|uniref:LIM zinc-binding domain-containing protein n=1 Tax=Eleutherodactylus coqui TaxID=57060 RepID=A0A8J6FRG9_ELECQ|nr:hypothetical protein GDO78_000575 [Eleutherodactylus coqui]
MSNFSYNKSGNEAKSNTLGSMNRANVIQEANKRRTLLQDNSWIKTRPEDEDGKIKDVNFGKTVLNRYKSEEDLDSIDKEEKTSIHSRFKSDNALDRIPSRNAYEAGHKAATLERVPMRRTTTTTSSSVKEQSSDAPNRHSTTTSLVTDVPNSRSTTSSTHKVTNDSSDISTRRSATSSKDTTDGSNSRSNVTVTQETRKSSSNAYGQNIVSNSIKTVYSTSDRSVMEKDICTYCRKPLGNDAKMILNDLNICCHATCFKCEACSGSLENLKAGDSMWIYKQTIHCEPCYFSAREKWII